MNPRKKHCSKQVSSQQADLAVMPVTPIITSPIEFPVIKQSVSQASVLGRLSGNKRTFFQYIAGDSDSDSDSDTNSETKIVNPIIYLHVDRIYRAVDDFSRLFGKQVHISTASVDRDLEHFKIVPFSHLAGDSALFELEEYKPNSLDLVAKDYQPGTAVVSDLSKDNVFIKRIFYGAETNKKLLATLKTLEKEVKCELICIDIDVLLTDEMDRIKIFQPKPSVKFGSKS